jgi:hypothetical protein
LITSFKSKDIISIELKFSSTKNNVYPRLTIGARIGSETSDPYLTMEKQSEKLTLTLKELELITMGLVYEDSNFPSIFLGITLSTN